MRISVAAIVVFAVLVTACGSRAEGPGASVQLSPVGQSSPSTAASSAGTAIAVPSQRATGQSGYKGTQPKIELVRNGDGWMLTVYQGQQNTGGYSVAIERMTSRGTSLDVNARFTAPARDAIVTDALTSPAASVDLLFAPDLIVLFDQDGRERARLQR